MSLWPDNHANGFSGTLGADLPFKSRYMGTVSYSMMRQNDAFLPWTITALPGAWQFTGLGPPNLTSSLPAQSLNGAINTLLINNVLTTKITPDLQTKLSYRYYDFNNRTPEILFQDWVISDAIRAGCNHPVNSRTCAAGTGTTAEYAPVQSISISYTKQNAAAQVDWRPSKQWNVGAAYGWERYDWTRADVDVTNEHSVKIFGDFKPAGWGVMRGSWEFSERRYENYNYLAYVASAQWPSTAFNDPADVAANGASTRYATAYRQFLLDNRERNKVKFLYDFDLIPGVVITPNAGVRWDDYRLDPAVTEGLMWDHSWFAGIDVSWTPAAGLTFLVSYMAERQNQRIRSGSLFPPATAANRYTVDVDDTVNTVMLAANWEAIPKRLDFKLSYTVSWTLDTQPLLFDNGTPPTVGGHATQYPDVRNLWQRVDAVAKYRFDEDWVHNMGFKGDIIATLRYGWERNHVVNWQIDPIAPYLGPVPGAPFAQDCGGLALSGGTPNNGCGYMVWIPWDNPNYNVQMVAGSVAFKW